MHWKRNLVFALIFSAVIAGLVYSYMPRAHPVSVALVRAAPLQVTISDEGKTRIHDRFVISAPVPAYAPRVELHVGDCVQPGQLLLELKPLPSGVLDPRSRAEAEARVAQARAALKVAEKNADAARASARLANAELKRIRTLYRNGDISRTAFEQAEAEQQRSQASLNAATFQIEMAKHELQASKTALAYGTGKPGSRGERIPISSPVDGCVIDVAHESEGVVEAGQPLLVLGDADSLEVVVDVLSQEAVRIEPATPVEFLRWGGGATLHGRVRLVEPVGFTKVSALGVEEQRVRVIADITSPPEEWKRLGDGYRVDARFIIWSGDHVLQVPASALFRHGDRWAVFRVVDEKAALTAVELGHEGEQHTEIVSGLKAGEQVVTHPDSALADGMKVSIRETEFAG